MCLHLCVSVYPVCICVCVRWYMFIWMCICRMCVDIGMQLSRCHSVVRGHVAVDLILHFVLKAGSVFFLSLHFLLQAFAYSPTLRTLATGSALVCCSGRVQGLLSYVLSLVHSRPRSFTLVNPGPNLSPAPGGKGQRGEVIFPSPMPTHGRQGSTGSAVLFMPSGLAYLCSQQQGQT